MIEVNNLHKSFIDKKNTVKALDGLSFTAKNGEITGILGPNGAGKTTCLRTLYGLLKADEGSVLVDGINVLEDPLAVRQRLGIFPDKFGLYERLTAYEQVDYFASLHGMQGAKKKAAIAQIFKDLEMEELAHRKTVGFSQGQRMKVTLAQALVHQPKNFVLDEPTRGLDVMSTRVLRNHLAKFKEKVIVFYFHHMSCKKLLLYVTG